MEKRIEEIRNKKKSQIRLQLCQNGDNNVSPKWILEVDYDFQFQNNNSLFMIQT